MSLRRRIGAKYRSRTPTAPWHTSGTVRLVSSRSPPEASRDQLRDGGGLIWRAGVSWPHQAKLVYTQMNAGPDAEL
jgi:hypothetical protein